MEKIFVDGHGMCEVWSLPKVAPKKQRKGKYVQESFVHPAKMDTVLCRKIIETYTEPGELVLDPMSGIFTTGVEAILLGRNAIGVELEEKFVNLTKQNIKLLEKIKTLTPKGKAVVIKGDSRELSKLLGGKADVAVFSPPFADAEHHYKHGLKVLGKNFRGRKAWEEKERVQSEPENIRRLKYGKPVDAIVTSPPYANTPLQDYATSNKALLSFERKVRESFREKGYYEFNGKRYTEQEWRKINKGELKPRGMPELWKQIISQRKGSGYSEIARVDAIVTSPPFNARTPSTNTPRHLSKTHSMDMIRKQRAGYPSRKDNIGNLPYKSVDAIVTSPPFAGTSGGKGKKSREPINARYPGLFERCIGGNKGGISENPANIDNLPYGKRVDTVVFSPPFAQAQRGGGIAQKGFDGPKHTKTDLVGRRSYMPENVGNDKGNISRMPYGKVDSVIFSPPYSGSNLGGGNAEARKKRLIEAGHDPKEFLGGRARNAVLKHYDQVDSIITSPPYSESMSKKRKGYTTHPELSKTRHMGLGSSDENISNLRHGKVDSIITSPPYECSVSPDKEGPVVGGNKEKYGRWKDGTAKKHSYTQDGEPCKVDAVVTSPPYEGSLEGTTRHTRGGIASRDKKLAQTGSMTILSEDTKKGVPVCYSPDKRNIGHLKKQTYLEAMLQVYRECYKTLKPRGKMVLVIKDFVRNKKVVRLDLDTKRLCEAAGFRWVETKLFRLPSKSFWRTLYERKYPEVDTSLLRFEFVEIFEKPLEVYA